MGLPALLLALTGTVLPNGLRVTVDADPALPTVATQVWVRVGSADERPGERGLAHLFEHLMFGPTDSRPAREYSDYHHDRGGQENAYTTPDETVYVSEIVPGAHPGVLEREADRFGGIRIDADTLANEQRIVAEELRLRIEGQPLTRLLTEAQAALLGAHPYGHSPTGTHEEIAAATPDSAREFRARWYGPANLHLVISGPVDPRATLDAVREMFGPLSGGPPPAHDVPPLIEHRFPDRLVLEEDLPPVEVALLGFVLPPADAPGREAREVLVRALRDGGRDLFRRRTAERGRGLEGGTEVLDLRRGGAVVFWLVDLPYRRRATAWRRVEQAVAGLSDPAGLTEDLVAGARRALRREILEGTYRPAARAEALGRADWWQGDAAHAAGRADRIAAVTLADVRREWEALTGPGRGIRVYLKPERVPLWIRLVDWIAPAVLR